MSAHISKIAGKISYMSYNVTFVSPHFVIIMNCFAILYFLSALFMVIVITFLCSSARQDEVKRHVRESLSELVERVYDCKIYQFKNSFLDEHVDSVALCDIGNGLEVC